MKLTLRDLALLKECHDAGVLSYAQVKRDHFANVAKCTCLNRLSILREAGLLVSHRVGLVVHTNGPALVGAVYQTTAKANAILKRAFSESPIRVEPAPLRTATLYHVLLLTDVLRALAIRFPGLAFTRKTLLKSGSENRVMPDAIATTKEGEIAFAVELELSAKTKARYRSLILDYKLETRFPKILYVTADASISRKIQREIGGYQSSSGKFQFVLLKSLFTNPGQFPLAQTMEVVR